ncbi:HAD family hydrolase [Streptomyces sp. NEAU-L66]|uniref:HAD family hydrolase n=1 Tax=Streptomyces sp. NEAU-L66 TaxID=3390812 RepID=UPI0039C5C3A0
MIRTLFVDAGGVLYNNINEETDFLARVADNYGVHREELARSIEERAHVYESGAQPVHQVLQRLVTNAQRPPRGGRVDARWLDHAYLESVRAYGDNFRALRKIREVRPDLRLVLTNNEAEHWDRLKDQAFGHFAMFDALCSSWRICRVKPARSFFVEALHRCRATAAETLVVDDRRTVLRTASALGMPTLHVSVPDVFADWLWSAVHDARPAGLSAARPYHGGNGLTPR